MKIDGSQPFALAASLDPALVAEDAMNFRVSRLIATFIFTGILGSAQSLAQNAYITNNGANTVSVIDTATNRVTATVPVGSEPAGVAVTPDGSKVFVANLDSNTVSVIDTATNGVTATVPVGSAPEGVAVTPDGSKVFVANLFSNTVSVIDTATNRVPPLSRLGSSPMPSASSFSRHQDLPGRPERQTVTARASRRSRVSTTTSMPRPQPWGTLV
jgi:YVTN family beta-propeller protein